MVKNMDDIRLNVDCILFRVDSISLDQTTMKRATGREDDSLKITYVQIPRIHKRGKRLRAI